MTRKFKRIVMTKRCADILRFLWLFKIATTATIAKKFYSDSSIEACYRRLIGLAKGGYIQAVPLKGAEGFFWTLDKIGFAQLKDELPPNSENGYLSECPIHDLIVLSAHLGSWLCRKPDGWKLFTDQQIKRIPRDCYPSWVPKSKIHRPDGYWYWNQGSRTRLLALEIELSQKKLLEYETVARFYKLDTKVDQVIWITGPRVNSNSIDTVIEKSSGSKNIHSFIPLKEFLKTLWQSKVQVGKSIGLTIEDLICQSPSNTSPVPEGFHFFDTRKYPVKSILNDKTQSHDFFHVTGASTPSSLFL